MNDLTGIPRTNEERALLGLYLVKPLFERFTTMAQGAEPDSTIWTTVKDGANYTIMVMHGSDRNRIQMSAGDSDNNDIMAHTAGSRWFIMDGLETLHIEFAAAWSAFNGETAIGLSHQGTCEADVWDSDTNDRVGIQADSGVVSCVTANASGVQTTDISAHVSATSTYYQFDIRVTASDVKFYIDGTLRATHTTRIPGSSSTYGMAFQIAAKNKGGVRNALYCTNIKVWGE